MYYAPHKLYKKVVMTTRDNMNRIISSSEEWQYVCDCRCDDNSVQKFEDDNGRVYIPKYKIVFDKTGSIALGEEIQCIVKGTDVVRGAGRVLNLSVCNYLNYGVCYV